jgi:V/A-type H+-transporting ATPase subunit A
VIEGKISRVSGPLVVARDMRGAKMFDVVRVGERGLIGEIIGLKSDQCYIQVYEETAGIGPLEPVVSTGHPLSAELGPGLIGAIYDGIQRPLDIIRAQGGDYIQKGVELPALGDQKKWAFKPLLKKGDSVQAGDVLGEVPESPVVVHKVLVPPGMEGTIEEIREGEFTVRDDVCRIKTRDGTVSLSMMQRWPVRSGRPVKRRLAPKEPLITGQRVIDTLFPVAKGGTACVPGPFGSGKTVIQHQLAKWANADIIVYIGCGERGNEMTDVLESFPKLKDPRTKESLMQRTVLIANTSNMPVAAREASVYTGVTLAEYYRDMGYHVAVMADSTSRWAEALREISGRLEEMPGEEGYPAYLGYRIANFYERAGRVHCLGMPEREATLSIVGAVSPPGGDLSDPVVQATLRVVKVFWGLEDRLAYMRHFPAINWLLSYSLYLENLAEYFAKEVHEDFNQIRTEAMRLLQLEDELAEIARLVGVESLSPQDRLVLESARSIREDFLHQNAFDDADTYTSVDKQYRLLRNIIEFYRHARELVDQEVELKDIISLPVRQEIARAKFIEEEKLEEIEAIAEKVKEELEKLSSAKTGQAEDARAASGPEEVGKLEKESRPRT